MDKKALYTCAVCLEIIDKIVSLPCSHMFCKGCIEGVVEAVSDTGEKPSCPACRERFFERQVKRRKSQDAAMHTIAVSCDACGKETTLDKLRHHNANCTKVKSEIANYAAASSQSASSNSKAHDAPNRSTFKCPYCSLKNLDHNGLVKHCNEKHHGSHQKVVCPICASMPWGDPNMKSSSFIHHLNQRHKFEYDTYVDYEQDDDEMLRLAMMASLEDS